MGRKLPLDVNGYVLAGGRSSRMGQDKALLELGGKPLIQRAVEKLRQVCAEVFILGDRPELESYAPMLPDLHGGCGPLGGIETALLDSSRDWNLLMAVDMPFLPVKFLKAWAQWVTGQGTAQAAFFTINGRPQPVPCLLHRQLAPLVGEAIDRGEFKLFTVLQTAANELATRQRTDLSRVLLNAEWDESGRFLQEELGWVSRPEQQLAIPLWFANLNTPQEFAMAKASAGLLDAE